MIFTENLSCLPGQGTPYTVGSVYVEYSREVGTGRFFGKKFLLRTYYRILLLLDRRKQSSKWVIPYFMEVAGGTYLQHVGVIHQSLKELFKHYQKIQKMYPGHKKQVKYSI